ncbi:hypothetical protein BD310DRAFT_129269 [Dichomitus squalens]|uniref:Uncharacterized protein n=1 Tax=Dichomitus squalens TaxID=114155 RepID=A0A4Q9PI68_9APHY|nr:hypothetical protein BD310DRAFT_129269 [Dichomitus squalens]
MTSVFSLNRHWPEAWRIFIRSDTYAARSDTRRPAAHSPSSIIRENRPQRSSICRQLHSSLAASQITSLRWTMIPQNIADLHMSQLRLAEQIRTTYDPVHRADALSGPRSSDGARK